MFLFNPERNGRTTNALQSEAQPTLEWTCTLPQFPPRCPESSAVIDASGNLYFGCHDNNIYALFPDGKIRWQFTTEDKVYSSPLLIGGLLYFCCNKADVICLTTEGKLVWSFEGLKKIKSTSRVSRIVNNVRSYLHYDYEFKKYMKIHAWGSPNILDNNIIINLYGIGVVALDKDNGSVSWSRDLGLPYFHLCGVAIGRDNSEAFIIAVSQSNGVFRLDGLGKITWRKPLVAGANSWSNPSIDNAAENIYCTTSKGGKSGWVFKLDYQGNVLWKKLLPGGIRGSVAISDKHYVVVPSLNGVLYILSKSDGALLSETKIGSADRGLWSSAVIDKNDNILINAKTALHKGALVNIDTEGKVKWKIAYGKALCVPIIDEHGCIFTGDWDGKFMKFRT